MKSFVGRARLQCALEVAALTLSVGVGMGLLQDLLDPGLAQLAAHAAVASLASTSSSWWAGLVASRHQFLIDTIGVVVWVLGILAITARSRSKTQSI